MRVGAGAAASEHQGAALCRQTPSLPLLARSLAVALQEGIKQVGCCRCQARRHALMGAAFGGHPAAREPQDAALLRRRRRGWRSAGSFAASASSSPNRVPRGRSSRWKRVTFFTNGPKPTPAGRRQGVGEGHREKKKTFLGARAGSPSASPRLGWPYAPGGESGVARPRPSSAAGFLRRRRAPRTPPPPGRRPRRGRNRPGGDGAGRDAAEEEAADAS